MEQRLRILHLEDDAVDAELVQAMLQEADIACEIVLAGDREEFEQALRSCPFDLILADYTLPGFDGLTALRIVVDHCGTAVPFIFVSGTLGEDIAAEAVRTGAVDYVLKSRLDRLPQAVRRALREVEERRQRQRAETALRESEYRFRTLTEALPQIVWSADQVGRVDYCNRRWEEYTGTTRDQAQGHEWQQLIYSEDRSRTEDVWRAAVETGAPHRIEHRLRQQDATYRWFLTVAMPLHDEHGRIVKWLGSSTDIHDQKLAQEQLQQINDLLESRVKERTRSLVEHQEQLRAMASDLTITEQRERRRLAAELHDYLAQLLVACKMKTRFLAPSASADGEAVIAEVNDLLEQSIKYTRTLIAELSPTILYEAGLVTAVHWLAEQMQRHGLRVEVEDGDNAGVQMPDDQAVLVFQTIRELLINVAKHAMVNEAKVILDQTTPGELKVTVSDRGVGFDAVAAEGPAAVGKYGLFSIRERLEALGGRFELQSEPGQGTQATLVVPLPLVEAAPTPDAELEEPAYEPAPAAVAGRSVRRRVTRVLLADDHHMVREGLRSIIESEPRLRVVGEASTGEEAIQQARVLHPDVVVMDINMPRMNGIEATRRLREEMPSIAVVALSMHEDRSMIAAMKDAGAVAYIPKGGASEELSRAIREAHCMVLNCG